MRLQCVVPYLLTALHDPSAAVRSLAVRGLVRTLARVQVGRPCCPSMHITTRGLLLRAGACDGDVSVVETALTVRLPNRRRSCPPVAPPPQTLPPSDVKVFQDYVLPSMSLIPNDPEEAVRAEYGMGLAHLAAAAHRWAAAWGHQRRRGRQHGASLCTVAVMALPHVQHGRCVGGLLRFTSVGRNHSLRVGTCLPSES